MSTSSQPIVITSISPSIESGKLPDSDADFYQTRCIRSWIEAGAHVVSVNNPAEIDLLENEYHDVEFVMSWSSQNDGQIKELTQVDDLLRVGCDLLDGTVFAVSRSDVHFLGDAEVLQSIFDESRNGCAFSGRYELRPHASRPGLEHVHGYDFVTVNNSFVSCAELEHFNVGAPWWHYLFIYLLAAREVPLTLLGSPVIGRSRNEQVLSSESWTQGLRLVARRLRQLSEEEGPVAALLGHMCRSLEEGAVAGFAIDKITPELGTILGASMASYITAACTNVMWFNSIDVDGNYLPRGNGHLVRHFGHFDYLGI
jgi:hypothetical protein